MTILIILDPIPKKNLTNFSWIPFQGTLWDEGRDANFTLRMGSPKLSPQQQLSQLLPLRPASKKSKTKAYNTQCPPSQDQVKALKEDLARLKVLATASALPNPSLAAEAVGLECPVCLQRPERIFCCHVRKWAWARRCRSDIVKVSLIFF